jgi:predicted SAM-dependent methyltransferase
MSRGYPDYGSGFARLWHHALFKVVPRHMLAPLRAEVHLALVRLRSFLRGRPRPSGNGPFLVNVGAGPYGRPDWVNIDGWRQPGVTVVHDCRRSLPLPDRSARGILCEHFLEHIDYGEELPAFLSECRRVLMPQGVLRIIVPDAELYLRAYTQPGWEEMHRIHGNSHATKMEAVNQAFRGGGWFHKYAYDYETLERALEDAGFPTVRRSEFGTSALPELAIDRPEHAKESLYVEAIK